MKLFLSIKYHADNGNRPQIEGITAALRQLLGETFAAGLVLGPLEEPAFAPEGADP